MQEEERQWASELSFLLLRQGANSLSWRQFPTKMPPGTEPGARVHKLLPGTQGMRREACMEQEVRFGMSPGQWLRLV
jgi:hypothetical protein